MERIELIAPCHFGMEAVLKREIQDLGYDVSRVEDGKITFIGDMEAVCYANVFLRSAERILIKIGFMQRPLMNCLKEPGRFHGKNIFRRMANSG